MDAIAALVPFPHQGHRRNAPDDQPLWVVAVFHGHRSPRVMAAILRSREDKSGKPV